MKWISVKDRLPANDDEYLLYPYLGSCYIGSYNKYHNVWFVGGEDFPLYYVSHWAEITPPKETK